MAIDSLDNILLEEKGITKVERQKVSITSEVQAENVSKIISVNGNFRILEKQVVEGKVNYNGRALVYFCYVDIEGNIKKSEAQTDFSGEISGREIKENSKIFLISKCEKVETESENIKLAFNLFSELKLMVFNQNSIELPNCDSEFITEKSQTEYIKSINVNDVVAPIDNSFDVNYCVKEVVFQKANATIKSVNCGEQCIEVNGDIFLSVIFLQTEDKKGIIKESKVFPFTVMVDVEECCLDSTAVAFINQKSLRTDVSVDEERGVSNISCSIILEVCSRVFVKQNVNVVLDAFSLDKQIAVESKKEKYFCYQNQTYVSKEVSGRANISEINVGSTLLCTQNENFEIISSSNMGKDIVVTGVYSCSGIFSDGENGFFTRKMETPIEINLDNVISLEDYEICCTPYNSNGKILSVSEVEISGELAFTISKKESKEFTYISNMNIVGEKPCENCAISVYIANNGESLWSISKRLNVNPDELKLTNPELNFPLSGNERIVVYRQKK